MTIAVPFRHDPTYSEQEVTYGDGSEKEQRVVALCDLVASDITNDSFYQACVQYACNMLEVDSAVRARMHKIVHGYDGEEYQWGEIAHAMDACLENM